MIQLFDAIAARLDPPEAAGPADRRQAAVLVPLFEKDRVPHLLFFLRTHTVPTHKGQICFPGGRWEPGDATLLDTALRETAEEIGVPAQAVRVLGYLGEQYTVSRGRGIQAFVGVIPYPFAFVPDPFEVDEILEIPIDSLRDPNMQRVEDWEWEGAVFPMRYYDIHATPLWGATARLTELFLERIEPVLEPFRTS